MSTSRKQPSAKAALLVFLGYIAVVVGMNRIFASDFNFDEVVSSASHTRDGIVLPVGVASIYLAGIATLYGWWRPALFEPRDRPSLPKWLWVIPIAGIAGFMSDIARSEHRDAFTNEHWRYLISGFLLVGFSEELMTRGLLVAGFRSAWSEFRVYAGTTALFGLMHGLNFFFGQDAATTVKQVLGVIPMATAFYIIRRISGSLVLAMLFHALLDFSLVVFGGPDASINQLDPDAGTPIGALLPMYLSIIAIIVHRKRFFSKRVGNAS